MFQTTNQEFIDDIPIISMGVCPLLNYQSGKW